MEDIFKCFSVLYSVQQYDLVQDLPDLLPVGLLVPLQVGLVHGGDLPGGGLLPAVADSLPLAGQHVHDALLQEGLLHGLARTVLGMVGVVGVMVSQGRLPGLSVQTPDPPTGYQSSKVSLF